MLRALIIDDQPPVREDLRDLLGAHADVVVVGEAGTIGRARTLLALDNYDLVLLDIELGQGEDGFALVPAVRPGARVVFVTAFDAYAVRAFEAEALDYLLKPVESSRLAKSLGRLRHPAGSASGPAPFTPDLGLVPVKIGPVTRLLRTEEIRTVASCENYTEVTLTGSERLMVRRTMQQWSEILRGEQFARVHRNLIVNVAQIERAERPTPDTTRLHFTGTGSTLEVSRRYAPQLRAKQILWQTSQAQREAAAQANRTIAPVAQHSA